MLVNWGRGKDKNNSYTSGCKFFSFQNIVGWKSFRFLFFVLLIVVFMDGVGYVLKFCVFFFLILQSLYQKIKYVTIYKQLQQYNGGGVYS